MEDLQDKIIELMDLFDEGEVTTADKIDRPQRALDREAIDDFMKRNPMAGGGMLVQPSADGSRPGYMGKNIMSGSPAQQAENIRREKESLKKISDLFKKKDYTGLKTRTPTARIKQGMKDKGGKLNQAQVNKITTAMEGGLKTQKEFAKKLGITHKQFLDGVEKSKSKISLEKSETMSKQMLKKIEFQEKLFKEIVNNPNATVDSMTKKFKVDKKYLVSQSSKLLKNVYAQNVSIAKGPEFDLDSRGKATLKSWLPDDFDTTEKFLDRFANIDGFKKIQAENMGILIKNAYAKTDPKKYADAMKALTEYNNFKNNLPKGLKVDLDHPLSKVFLKGSGVSPDKLLYVTPVNRDFNRGFKMQMGNRYAKALLQGDKAAIKNVRALADKLKINIGDVKGSKLDFGTTKFDTKKDFGKEYMANIKEQTTVAEELNKLQKTKEGKQIIKDAGFKKGQIKEVQKISKGLLSQLEKLGCGKAAGGRVFYNDGAFGMTKCAKEGQLKLERILTKGASNADDAMLAKTILKAGGGLKSAFALRNIFGPAAIAATVAFEGGLIGYDMLTSGKTLREAFGDNLLNYALGKDYQIDPQEEMFKRFKGLGYNDQQIGSIKRALDAMNTINTGTQLAMDVGQQQEALQKSRGQTEEFMIPDDQMMADTAGQRAEQNLKDARERLTAFNQSLEAVDRPGGMKKEDVLEEYFSSGKYAQDLDLFDQAQKAATVEQMQSALPTAFGKVFPKFEERRTRTISENLPFGGVNPAFNIPGARDATFIPGKTVGGLYGLAEGGRAGYKLGKIIKPKPSKVRADAKSIIDENIKLMKQMKETGEIKEISSDLNQVIKKALDEDLFDKKDRIVDSINISEAKKRRNYPYNMQVQEEPKNLDFYTAIQESNFKTKTGPYFDRIRRLKRAGGGLLKLAGDRSGPPPESGPNSQGLQGLLNRGKKI